MTSFLVLLSSCYIVDASPPHRVEANRPLDTGNGSEALVLGALTARTALVVDTRHGTRIQVRLAPSPFQSRCGPRVVYHTVYGP
jgi:hypothetical protein